MRYIYILVQFSSPFYNYEY